MKVMRTLILLTASFAVPFGIVLVPTGCGESTQDADAIIKLVADPALNSEQEVAEHLVIIEILFDAPGGFQGINENNPEAEGFVASDVDEDGEVELLLKMSWRGRQSLPTIGLNAGLNRSTPIAVRTRGLDQAGQVAALGGIDPRVLFSASGQNEVEVPFNLDRSRLPPRIVGVAPLAVPRDGVLKSIAFYASRPLDTATFEGNISVRVVPSGGGGEEEVSGTFAGPTPCPFGTQMYTFMPVDCHQSVHRLSGVKLAVGPGVTDTSGQPLQDGSLTTTISIDQVKEFGSCTLQIRCDEIGITAEENTDIVCNLQTGLFEPAPCSLSVLGCQPEAAFDWVRAAGTPECQAFRPGTLHQDGACVVQDPWPCTGPDACAGVGTGTCDDGAGQCVPDPCTDTCTPGSLACVSGEGCLPKIGGCNQDCQMYGACPEFDQECVLGESGGHVCR